MSTHGAGWRAYVSNLDPVVSIAVLISIALMLTTLGDAAMWFDETFTASLIRLPWRDLIDAIVADNHLPLYFLIIKAWSLIAGDTAFSLRLPSAIFSVLLVPLTASIAWSIKDRSAARWAAVFTAISPYLLQHGQEARMYPLLGLLAAINMLLLVRYLSAIGASAPARLGTAFVIVNAALLATHYYALFFVVAELGILVLLAWRQWRSWAFAMAVSLLLILGPLYAAWILRTPYAGTSYDIGLIALPGLVWSLISGYTLLPSSEELHKEGLRAALPYAPFAFVGLVALLVIGVTAIRSLPLRYLLLLAIIVCAVVIGPFVASLILHIGVNPRYAIAAVPALIVFIAMGAPRSLSDKPGLIATALLLFVMATATAIHVRNPGHGREDIHTLGKWLDKNVPVEEQILITSHEMALLAAFHWPQRRFITYPARKVVVNNSNVGNLLENIPLSRSHRTIYIVGRAWLSDPDDVLRSRLKRSPERCPGMIARGVEVLCLQRGS
ncbi:MAG TPA: glycosyltransferase family 39 protein [Burkholderiales bacterium]|nr:glycosyltransferase family 39 protein [Burkholderiales bacterium]